MIFQMKTLKFALILVASLVLIACGGGAGCSGFGIGLGSAVGAICSQSQTSTPTPPSGIPGTLSGVAAGGAPIIGNVEITDSLGAKRGETIEANGHYAVNVQGMTGPFVIKAGGRVGGTWVTYYSVGLTADIGGTINITPFTDIIVSSLAATVADKFGNGADPKVINQANIERVRVALYQKLYPILQRMGIEDGIDFLRSVFNADHTKLDALFDLLQVQSDPATNIITLKDFIHKTTLGTIDVTKPMDNTPIPAGLLDPNVSIDIREIVQVMQNITSLFATQLPSPQKIATSGWIDTSADFMDSGQSFQQWADELSSSISLIGWKTVSIEVKINSDLSSATATGLFKNSQGISVWDSGFKTRFVKKQGKWLFQGDGLISLVRFSAIEEFHQNTNQLLSGVGFDVDPFAYNNGKLMPDRVVTASITGPGLATTLPLAQNEYDTWLGVSVPGAIIGGGDTVYECLALVNWPCLNIENILNNSEYNLILKGISGNILNGLGYKTNLMLAPLPTKSLKSEMFGKIDAVTINGQPPKAADFKPNQSMLVSYTFPTSLRGVSLQVSAEDVRGYTYFRIQKPILDLNKSSLIGWTIPDNNIVVSHLTFRLTATDFNGRKFVTNFDLPVSK